MILTPVELLSIRNLAVEGECFDASTVLDILETLEESLCECQDLLRDIKAMQSHLEGVEE